MVGPGPLKEMLEWFYREVILVYQVKAFPEGEVDRQKGQHLIR
jgi:hypothetical protein